MNDAHTDGGWISGPSITTEPAETRPLRLGNHFIVDEQTIGEVVSFTYGSFWMDNGQRAPGVSIQWRAAGGHTSSGVIFRRVTDEILKVAADV